MFYFLSPLVLLLVVIAPKLNTSSPTNDSIRVTWPPVEHATRYTLIMIREGSSTRLTLNTTDTTVMFNDLEAGISYCIKGMAWDTEGRTGDDLTVCQITRKHHFLHIYLSQPHVSTYFIIILRQTDKEVV